MSLKAFAVRSALLALVAATAGFAQADAAFRSMKSDVRVAVGTAPAMGARQDPRLEIGTTAHAILRFDDGQQVVLNDNSDYQITDYRYRHESPKTPTGAVAFISNTPELASEVCRGEHTCA